MNLTRQLALLYPTEGGARTIVSFAEIPEAQIDYGDGALAMWGSVVRAAALHRRVPSLVEAARTDYPENATLREASETLSRDPHALDLQTEPASSGSPQQGGHSPRIPFILPQIDVPTFTGRSVELAQLESVLLHQDGEKVSSIAGISGTGGLGKTALACHFAELHRAAFTDGVIGLRVDGKEPITIARDFVRSAAIDLEPEDARDASTLMQETFRERRALLIFDNTRDAGIRSLLPGGTRCAVIITTRDRGLPAALGLPDAARLDVSPLAPDDAVRLLRQLVPDRVETERDAAARICVIVGNLPLAIQIVGATLRMQEWRTLSDFESALLEEKARLSTLRVRGDAALDLRVSFSLTLELLDASEIEFFGSLSVCAPEGFSAVAAAAANGCDDHVAKERLAQLFRMSLVNRVVGETSRFVLHPLLRLFAREQAEQLDVLKRAESQHRDFFRNLVMRQDATDPEVATLLAPEIDDIVTAAESLERDRLLDGEFLLRLEPLLSDHGYWLNRFGGLLLRKEEPGERPDVSKPQDEGETKELLALAEEQHGRGDLSAAAETLQRAVSVEAVRGNRIGEAEMLLRLGAVFEDMGRFESATDAFRRSYTAALRDDRKAAVALSEIGGALQRQGKFDEAVDAYRESYTLWKQLDDPSGQALLLNSLGGALQRQGRFAEAVDVFHQSYELLAQLGDARGQAMLLSSLGGVLQRQGKFDGAVEAFRQSHELSMQLGDTRGQATVLTSLGGVFQRQGKFDEAVAVFRQSYELFVRLDDIRGQAMVLNSLGGVLQRQGDFTGAIEVLQRSLGIEARLGDRRGEAMVLNSLGGVLQRQGKLDEAAEALRRSHVSLTLLDDTRGQAMVLNSLGGVLQRQGKFDEAVEAFRKSYKLLLQLDDERGQAMVLNSLGGALQRHGKTDQAYDAFRESIRIGENLRDRRHLAMVHTAFGRALLRTDRVAAAEQLRAGFEIDLALGNKKGVGIVAPLLAETLLKLGRRTEATEICDRALHIIPNDERLLRLKADLDRKR
jgi:tetratricopeptide (TPR) repeat protein